MTPQELKQQAHKEFDEKFPRLMVSINESPWDRAERMEADGMIMWKFIESLIDKAVQMTEERLMGIITKLQEDGLNVQIEGDYYINFRDLESLITNKSDINK